MNDLLIDKVEIVDCADLVGPGDDAQLVAVHAAGLTGWYGPVSAAAAALLDGRVAALALGASVTNHSGLLARLRRGLGVSVGTPTSWAIGALDCAVWDLHGRAEERPVAALLAADVRSHVPAYASWLRLDIHTADPETIGHVVRQGWLFTKWSLRSNRDLPVGEDSERMADAVHRVTEAVGSRAAFDALWTWDEALALGFAERVDHTEMIWLEEPLARYDAARYTDLVASCPPLALGERLNIGDDPSALLGLRGLSALTIDVVGCGGLTVAASLLAKATAVGVPVYPHGRSLVPGVHLGAAFPDAVAAVEYQLQWEPHRQRLFTDPLECNGGRIVAPSTPGLGPIPRRR